MNRTTSFAVMVVCLALAIFVGAYGETLAPSVAPAAKLPAAPFVEGRMNGLQVSRRGDYSYTPSVAIKAAATRHDSGLWPFRRSWYEFAPPGASPKAVVVLLHGAGRDGLSMLEMWRDTAVRHELLLVAPNGRGGAWPGGDADRAFISGLAREAATARGLPAEGVFLFGHSAGARLAQEILNQAEPGRWRAAAVHGGFADAATVKPAFTASPFRMYLGSEDHIFSLDAARRSGRAMAANGHPVELMVIARHTHWFYEIGPKIAEDAWRWFSARRQG